MLERPIAVALVLGALFAWSYASGDPEQDVPDPPVTDGSASFADTPEPASGPEAAPEPAPAPDREADASEPEPQPEKPKKDRKPLLPVL